MTYYSPKGAAYFLFCDSPYIRQYKEYGETVVCYTALLLYTFFFLF